MLTKHDFSLPDSGCMRIDLGNGLFAIIDAENYTWVDSYLWHVRHAGGCKYAVRKVRTGGKEFLVPMHRMIMHCPTDKVVHHINHNGLDNRKENLIIMTKDQHHELHRFN